MDYSILVVPACCFFLYMSILWGIGIRIGNAGLVDFGWPSGFTAITVYLLIHSEGDWKRTYLLSLCYGLCGLRFMVGWIVRNVRDGEDRRWNYWRNHWLSGKGLLGIRSTRMNFFVFYHAQTLATLFVLIVPVVLVNRNSDPHLHPLEWLGALLWLAALILENVADFQLDHFRCHSKGKGVCRKGLWRYSRHPNYFFEFMIWLAYAVFALPSAENMVQFGILLLVPVTAYWFLVYFTGIPITEAASLDRRGDEYAKYQAETNRFFPWFARTGIR